VADPKRVRSEKLTASALRVLRISDRTVGKLEKLGSVLKIKLDATGELAKEESSDRRTIDWYVNLVQKFTRAHVLLLKELRSQEKDGRKAGEDVPEEEWPQYVRRYVERMPQHRRRAFMTELRAAVGDA